MKTEKIQYVFKGDNNRNLLCVCELDVSGPDCEKSQTLTFLVHKIWPRVRFLL